MDITELSNNLNAHKQNRLPVFINPNFKAIWYLLITSMLFALAYAYLKIYILGENIYLLKISSIALLALVVKLVKTTDLVFNRLLMTALLLHCIGDGVIEACEDIVYALPFFLLGHVLYATIFLRDIMHEDIGVLKKISQLTIAQCALIVFTVGAVGYLCSLFLPIVSGVLFYSLIVYIVIFAGSVLLCIIHPVFTQWLGLGIFLYVLSDSIIAYHEFVVKTHIAFFLSWPIYYFAQLAITYGLLNYHLNIKNQHNDLLLQ